MKIQLTESELKNYIRQIVAESMEEETDEVLGGLGRLGGKMWDKAKTAVSNIGQTINDTAKKVKDEYQKGEKIAANNKLIAQANKIYDEYMKGRKDWENFKKDNPTIANQIVTKRGKTIIPDKQSLMADV